MNADLERAIDDVGRDRVFLRAKSYGWSNGDVPPEYVWWGIVQELRAGVPPPATQPFAAFDFMWR